MAKRVKFPLNMGTNEDIMVRDLNELKDNYNTEKVTEYFLNGKLITWLEDRYYDEEAEQVRKLSEQSDISNFAAELGKIFGVETLENVDVEALEIRRKKLEELRKITADDEILKNVDCVAFSQEELGDLLDEEVEVIYLCGANFRIPMSIGNVRYVGVNNPTITLSGKGEIDLEANGIVIERCEFSDDTKARLIGEAGEEKDDGIPYTIEENFDFKVEDDMTVLIKYKGSDTFVKIPNTVNIIGANAFSDCETLEEVTIPKSVSQIRKNAFRGCKKLLSIHIPNSVTKIGSGVFMDCISLKNVELPSDITRISNWIFYGCENLENVNIPKSVTKIGERAFMECINLKSIEIPDGVTEIEYQAFFKCQKITDIIIPTGVKEISNCVFCQCDSLKSVKIPNGITKIDVNAFSNCESLKEINIPDGVTEIGEKAFWYCESLKSINIPDSVKKIGKYAFGCCTNIKITRHGKIYDCWHI